MFGLAQGFALRRKQALMALDIKKAPFKALFCPLKEYRRFNAPVLPE